MSLFDKDKITNNLLEIEYDYNNIIKEITGDLGSLTIDFVYKENKYGGNPYMAADISVDGEFLNLITYRPCSMTYPGWIAEIKAYLFDRIYLEYA